MADRVFCIDFGSAFTKVALRRDPSAESSLIRPKLGGADEDIDFLFPSAVAVDRRGSKAKAEFGDAAASLKPEPGLEVHRNWKRSLFHTPKPGAAADGPPPLEAFLQSTEARTLAAKFGVPDHQFAGLQHLAAAARATFPPPPGQEPSNESRAQELAGRIAFHFLVWLRERVLAACAKLPASGLKFEEIPVRVAVPAFAVQDSNPHPGTTALVSALRKAGWQPHPDRPALSEPYANAIGVLTGGTNFVFRGRLKLAEMFGKTPLITVLKNPEDHPSYRAVVVDVGAYTTDLAAVSLDTHGGIVDDPDRAMAVEQSSIPLGITNLDERLLAALPPEKSTALADLTAYEWDELRRSLYGSGKAYRRPNVWIGGPADADLVKGVVEGFATEVGEAAGRFCSGLPSANLQELVLTGGGCLIPAVRDAIRARASASGHNFVKTHGAGLKRETGKPTHKLDESLARGGSALGGASVYFDREFYG